MISIGTLVTIGKGLYPYLKEIFRDINRGKKTKQKKPEVHFLRSIVIVLGLMISGGGIYLAEKYHSLSKEQQKKIEELSAKARAAPTPPAVASASSAPEVCTPPVPDAPPTPVAIPDNRRDIRPKKKQPKTEPRPEPDPKIVDEVIKTLDQYRPSKN
jgi:hypothetical protein